MGKVKRIISILISVMIVLSAVYLPIHTVAQSNGNLFEDSTITANDEYYNGWYEYNRPLSALIDGNTYVGVGYNAGNMFATEYSSDGLAFVNFKPSTAITLNKLVVYLTGTSAAQTDVITDYAVDVKLLDDSWKRVAEKHTEVYDNWDAYVETLCFEEVTVSEVKFTFKNAKGQTFASVYEIEAWYDNTITSDDYTELDISDVKIDMPKPINVLANKTASCSSGYNSWYAENRPVSKLTDGKYEGGAGEMWAIDYIDGYAYFEFEFESVKSINKIITSFPGIAADVTNVKENDDSELQIRQIKDYAIDGLLEDGSWTRLAERHIDTNDEATDYYSDVVIFETAKVKKLRFTFANAYNQQWAAVREVEAYHDNSVTLNDYTAIDCKDFTKYAIIKPEYKNILNNSAISVNEAYYNDWYPENRALSNLTDGNTFVGVGYNAGNATVIPYEEDGQAYVNFELNKKSIINKITIFFPGLSAYAKELQVDSFAIEVKTDEEWERVAVRNLENSDNWDAYSDTVTFNKIECEEIRIIFVRENGQQTLAIFEIEAIADNRLIDSEVTPEDPPEELPETLENLLKDTTEITANESYYNGWYPDNRALANIVDGNTFVGVGYNAGNAAAIPYEDNAEAYINLKLKEKTTLNKLVIYFPGTSAYPKTEQVKCYIVEVKIENEWKRVSVRNIENSDNWDAYSDTATFNKVECEEIRVIFIKAKGQEAVSIFEIEAYYDPEIEDTDIPLDEPMEKPEEDTPNIPEKNLQNILKDATEITANDAYYNGWYPENRALSNLIDGNTYVGIGYNGGNAAVIPYESNAEAFVNFKLKEKSTLNKLDIYFPGKSAYPKAEQVKCYIVEAKVGKTWKRVAVRNIENSDNWDAYLDTATFNKVECEEIRIIFIKSKGQEAVSIFEIEAYYDPEIKDTDKPLEEPMEKPEEDTPNEDTPNIPEKNLQNILKDATEITANEAYYNGWYPENRALSNLTDGNTYVGIGYNAGNAAVIPYEVDGDTYVNFKLNKKTTLNQIVIYFPGTSAYPKDQQVKCYVVEAKVGKEWKRVAVRNIENSDNWDAYSDTATFNKVKCEEIRIIFIKAKGQTTLSLFEIEGYYNPDIKDSDKPLEEIPTLPTNILKDATEITANDAYYNGWYPENRALSNLIDGNTFIGVGYNAGSAAVIPYEIDGDTYVNFKLKKKSSVNQINIYFPGTSAYSLEQQVKCYVVEVKTGKKWKRVAVRNIENSENWDAYLDTATFKKVECEEIRIIFIKAKGQETLSLFEVEAYYDPDIKVSNEPLEKIPELPKNILKDATEITANDAYYNGWYPDNRALSNLIDGNTYVGVGYNAGNAAVIPYEVDGDTYVNFKLNKKTAVNQIDIYFPGTSAYPVEQQVKCYVVEVKVGKTWKRVAVRNIENSDNWDAYSDTATFNKIKCEEIRIIFIKAKGQTTLSLFEVEAYYDPEIEVSDEPLEKIPTLPTNILKDATEITANDAYYNGWYPENRALSNLIDGNTYVGIGYNAGNAAVVPYESNAEAFVNFKLKEKTSVNQLDIYFPGTSAYEKSEQVKCYIVEVKNGDKWKRVAVRNIKNSDNWDAYLDTATFNKIECEEIRVIFIKSKGQEAVSLFEVEAYYDPEIKDSDKPLEEPMEKPKDENTEKNLTNILKDSTKITANKAYYNGWYPENRALSNLIDGNTFVGVGYNAGSAAVIPYEVNGDTFVNFKLKKKTTVNQIDIYFPGTSAYPVEQQVKCYVIEVKLGKEWKRVAVRNIENSDNWDAYSDMATFNEVKCEEIRIIFIKSKGQETLSLFEVEAYYNPDITDSDKPLEEIPKAPENILKNANKITANDAYYNGWYPTYRPLSKATDGDTSFKFDASKATMIPYGSSKLAFIQYDFEKTVKANKFLYYSPDAGDDNTIPLTNRLTDYAVDVKLSDGTWERIIEHHGERVENWDIYYDEYLFETVEFIALRFVSKSADAQTYLAISELELNFDVNEENKTPYMNRYVSNKLSCTSDKINNAMFGTQKEIEMPIVSVISGVIPTTGLGDNSWYKTERPLKNITDGIQDVFTPANISTIDYHANIAYYNFEISSCKKVNTVRFFVPQKDLNAIKERPTDFAVDVMLRDGTWKRVAEKHIAVNKDEAGYCETITFETEECMQIRLTSVSNGKMSYFALSEIEVYFNTYLAKGFTGIQKSPSLEREVPYPKIRLVPIAKFN